MLLTVKDAIEQEKLLSEFIPFVEIAIQVRQLSLHHQVAFFCSCCERMLPLYTLVDGYDGILDMSILRSVVDELWQIADGMDIQQLEIESLVEKIASSLEEYEYYQADDYKDVGHENIENKNILLAIYVSDILNRTVEYISIVGISNDRVDLFLKIFVTIVFTIQEYLIFQLYNIDPLWELKKSRKGNDEMLINHALNQLELEKETADLKFLKDTPELTSEILSIFRSNSYTKGFSILGSLNEVRANLNKFSL